MDEASDPRHIALHELVNISLDASIVNDPHTHSNPPTSICSIIEIILYRESNLSNYDIIIVTQ